MVEKSVFALGWRPIGSSRRHPAEMRALDLATRRPGDLTMAWSQPGRARWTDAVLLSEVGSAGGLGGLDSTERHRIGPSGATTWTTKLITRNSIAESKS